MALKILYQRVNGTLTVDISAAATLLPIDASSLALLQTQVNFVGGDWTYLTLTNQIYSEEVKVIGITGSYLVVQRAKSGSTAQVFSATDTDVFDHVGADAIVDIINANPSPSNVTVSGSGIAGVTKTGSNYAVSVVTPNFVGSNNVVVTGTYPNLTFSYEGSGEGCGCSGGGSGTGTGIDTVVVVSSILQAAIAPSNVLTLTLPAPTFTGTGGVTVSGSWADGYVISGGGGGGTGTVVSVGAGTGLTLTGSPNTNPTLSLTATGVAAGTYGGFTFNAQGQLTGVTGGYNPVGSLVFTNGATATLAGTSYTVTLSTADVGVQGIVALADSGAPLSSTDDTTAVTPKLLASVLSGLGGSVMGAGSSNGESDAAYTNVLSTAALGLTLTATQKALIIGEVEVVNATPSTPSNFGVAVFNTSNVKLYSSRQVTQNKQPVVFILNGPMSTNISLVTTALAGGDSVTSSFLSAVIY